MATSSAKQLFCYLHIGGQFINGVEGETQYVGGGVRTRMIKEGTSYGEFRTMVASIVGKESNGMVMKFTVTFDECTFVDLVDDEGVEHLINFNGDSGHVYIGENGDQNSQLTRDVVIEEQHVMEDLFGGSDTLSMSPPNVVSEDPLLLPCGSEMMPTPIPEMNSIKWKGLVIGEGQIFPNAVALRQALYRYSIAVKFSYKFVKNNQQKIIVKCMAEGCPWYMGAYSMGQRQDSELLIIRTLRSEHVHYAQDSLVVSHSRGSNLTSSIMIDSLRCNIDKNANELRRDLYREYGVRLNYSQAYRGRERALREIHGRAQDSYMAIPWICQRLIETDPNTSARWEGLDSNRFQRVFIAYGCSINGFLEGCRHILYIDGCHLSGPYRGTLISANAYDADNELFPLAYAIVSGETYDDWAWFLQNIKDITRSVETTIVSDRNNAIIGAVRTIFGGERHAFCYRHVKENFSAHYLKINRGRGRVSGTSKDVALKMLDGIAYARIEDEYVAAMGKLRSFCPQLADWVDTQGDVDRWALSKFPFKRWDNITTNVAESFNAWILKERKHNVSVLIHEHMEKLAKKMVASKMAMENWTNGVGPNIESKLQEKVARAENMHTVYYGDNRVQVDTTSPTGIICVTVDLTAQKCTCLAWQMSGLPCAHACAAIKLLHGSVYEFVDDCYKLSAQEKIYASSMRPIATHDCPRPEALTVTQMMTGTFLQPPITKRPSGRPKKRRIESQFQSKKLYHCGRCHEPGHTVKTCQNPNPS
ncbi:uncharacterized protein LOC114712539 [Neltuma alba]|uniref:uncharacterized protein LOC114712539 n=2 Tax=Neltuma alba TaxID=207710 RepID=UPI0010A52C93|nr:uncharacterized protein LOC114712539 [Prosopis alba]